MFFKNGMCKYKDIRQEDVKIKCMVQNVKVMASNMFIIIFIVLVFLV